MFIFAPKRSKQSNMKRMIKRMLAAIITVFTDVMNTYFGRGDVPIDLVREGIKNPAVWTECATIFTSSATGNFRYQIAGDATWSAAMLDKIRTFNRIQE